MGVNTSCHIVNFVFTPIYNMTIDPLEDKMNYSCIPIYNKNVLTSLCYAFTENSFISLNKLLDKKQELKCLFVEWIQYQLIK